MSNDRRIGQVYAKLTVEERVVAILAARQADRRPDRAILASMPDAQVPAYNQYAARLERLDSIGRAWVLAIALAVDEIHTRLGWLMTLIVVDARLEPVRWELQPQASARGPAQLHRAAADALQHLGRLLEDEEDEDAAVAPPPLAEMLRAQIRIGVGRQWAELRAIETVIDGLGAELRGADPLPTDVRDLLIRSQERLRALATEPLLGEEIVLQEPADELRDRARAIVGDLMGV